MLENQIPPTPVLIKDLGLMFPTETSWNNGYAVCKVENLVIKPSEPEYEWQWLYIKADSTAGITKFFTDEEAQECYQWVKIEETKRIREV